MNPFKTTRQIACLLPAILSFAAGCITPHPDDYRQITFEKVHFPGTESLSPSEFALVQTAEPNKQFNTTPIVVYSVDRRPVFCTITPLALKLVSTEFGPASAPSTIIRRPILIINALFHPMPYQRFPLPMRQSFKESRQLVLPPGEHEIEVGLHDFGEAIESIGTKVLKVQCEAGKKYVIRAEWVKGKKREFAYSFVELER